MGRTSLVLVLIALAACSGDPAAEENGVQVVTTTDVLGDVVTGLVGSQGRVTALMEAGTDPHDFTPTAEQTSLLRTADVVVVNGLGLEANLSDSLEAAAADGATVVELAELVQPLRYEDTEEEGDGGDHDHGEFDPHFTLDPLRMADAVEIVAGVLADVDDSVDWQGKARTVGSDLEDLHRQIEDELSTVPPERRKLVTNHDALRYFASRYDFEVVATIVEGGGTMAEPSPSHLAELADLLRREEIRAVFADTEVPAGLAETVAAEAGGDVEVHYLHTGSLGPEGSGADTYAGMMRTNAATIAAALGG